MTVKLPKLIEVHRAGREFSLTIDGEPFEYAVTNVHADLIVAEAPAITLTLIAERIEVSDRIRPERSEPIGGHIGTN